MIGSYDYFLIKAKACKTMEHNLSTRLHIQYDVWLILKIMTSCLHVYTFGNAGIGDTYRNNFKALQRWHIVLHVLRNTTHRNLNVGSCISLSSKGELIYPLRPPFLVLRYPRPLAQLLWMCKRSYTNPASLRPRAQRRMLACRLSCQLQVHVPSRQ
jgi:hypothetical protein